MQEVCRVQLNSSRLVSHMASVQVLLSFAIYEHRSANSADKWLVRSCSRGFATPPSTHRAHVSSNIAFVGQQSDVLHPMSHDSTALLGLWQAGRPRAAMGANQTNPDARRAGSINTCAATCIDSSTSPSEPITPAQ